MKSAKKILSYIIAAAMTVSLMPAVSFAAPEEEPARPSIANPLEAGEDYIGGYDAIDWEGSDWGALGTADWTGAADLSADELAQRLKASGVNALSFDGGLVFKDGGICVGLVGGDALSEEELGGITIEGNEINFPEGDTALISSSMSTALNLTEDAVINIPDGSSAAVIIIPSDKENNNMPEALYGKKLTINTNESGNFAAVSIIPSYEANYGAVLNTLNVNGGGTVAMIGGPGDEAEETGYSMGVGAININVNRATFIATTIGWADSSTGIRTTRSGSLEDTVIGSVSADNGARIIGAGSNVGGETVGIETMDISAKNGSEIYAYGGNVTEDEWLSQHYISIGLRIEEGVNARTIEADNGSAIYARAGDGTLDTGISDNYSDFGLSDEDEVTPSEIVYGGLNFSVDESENAEPSHIIAAGGGFALMQWRDRAVNSSQRKEPTGDIQVRGCENTDGSGARIAVYDNGSNLYTDGTDNLLRYLDFTKSNKTDHYLVYNPEDSSFYDDYTPADGDNEAKLGNKIENVPGAECDGKYLTLTSEFQLDSAMDTALWLLKGTSLYIPEGETVCIKSGDGCDYSTAILCEKSCEMEIDGTLVVRSGDAEEESIGIVSLALVGDLLIYGPTTGNLYAYGGDITQPSVYPYSAGIHGNIEVRGTNLLAESGCVEGENAPEEYVEGALSIGICGNIYAANEAVIAADGGGCAGNADSFGCYSEQITANGAEIYASGNPDFYNTGNLFAGIGLANYEGSYMRAVNGGVIECDSGYLNPKEAYALCEVDMSEDAAVPFITVDEDSYIESLGGMRLRGELPGSYTAKSYDYINEELTIIDVTFDADKKDYVDSEGNWAGAVKFIAEPEADYGIYYDAETGFRKNTKDGDEIERLPYGMDADGNTLTLNNTVFGTTYETALRVGEGVTVNIPEDSLSILTTKSSATNKIADGIIMEGGNALNLDGGLKIDVSGSDAGNYAIRSKDLTVSGSGGSITTYPGAEDTEPPAKIHSSGDLTLSGEVYIYSDIVSVTDDTSEKVTLTVKDNAYLELGDDPDSSLTVENMLIEGHGAVDVFGGCIFVTADEENPGEIRLRDTGDLFVSSDGPVSVVGCYDADGLGSDDGNTPIIVEDDARGITDAVSHVKAADGTKAIGGHYFLDNYELQYDDENYTYIIPDTGETATSIRFVKSDEPSPSPTVTTEPSPEVTTEPSPEVTAEPTPLPTAAPKPQSGASGGFKPSSSESKPAATAAPKATATPEATAAPEATSAPEATAPAATQQPEPTNAPSTGNFPFVDVKPTDWFYNAVKAAYTEGLINGVTETEFAPNTTLTRGMLVTIVGRMGAAETVGGSSFTDVDANAYYAPYVAWAAENGIVSGFGDSTFKPDETVTREQTAAILYRYMKYIGADVSVGENTNILSYTDASAVSEYAVPAIQWACGAEIINGYPDGSLAPQKSITRAEFASIISAVSLN